MALATSDIGAYVKFTWSPSQDDERMRHMREFGRDICDETCGEAYFRSEGCGDAPYFAEIGFSETDFVHTSPVEEAGSEADYSTREFQEPNHKTQEFQEEDYIPQDFREQEYSRQEFCASDYSAREFHEPDYSTREYQEPNYSTQEFKEKGFKRLEYQYAGDPPEFQYTSDGGSYCDLDDAEGETIEEGVTPSTCSVCVICRLGVVSGCMCGWTKLTQS